MKSTLYSTGAQCQPLTEEQAQGLLARYRDGEYKCRDDLIFGYYRLAWTIAKEFKGVPREDLIQEGVIAIVRAVDRYDPARGLFLPFVARLIRNRMGDVTKRDRNQRAKDGILRKAQKCALLAAQDDGREMDRLGEVEYARFVVERLRASLPDILPDPLDRAVFTLNHGLADGVQWNQWTVGLICGLSYDETRTRLRRTTRAVKEWYAEEAMRTDGQWTQRSGLPEPMGGPVPGVPVPVLEHAA